MTSSLKGPLVRPPGTPKVFTISETRGRIVIETISKATGIPIPQILGPVRRRPIARARQMAYWVLAMGGASTPQIGRMFNRDHTTALWGARLINHLRDTNPEVRAATDALLAQCRDAMMGDLFLRNDFLAIVTSP